MGRAGVPGRRRRYRALAAGRPDRRHRRTDPPASGPLAGRHPGPAGPAADAVGPLEAPPATEAAAVLVERTILVRIIPRTGVFARLRAAVALTVIAVTIGLGVAADAECDRLGRGDGHPPCRRG